MDCEEGYSLTISASAFVTTSACSAASNKCNTALYEYDWTCDKCDPAGGIKCHKCIEGKTCSLDCSTHPYANKKDFDNLECVATCPSYTFINGDHCEQTNKCDEDCLECVDDGGVGKCLKCSDDNKG